jgi:ribosomal protein S12 methylthiotransferase
MADDVPDDVKQERLEQLNELQRMITAERYEQRVGRTVRALVDRVEIGNEPSVRVQARTAFQADDIDGVTYVTGGTDLAPGMFIDVRLDEVVDDFDFNATFVRVVSAPAARPKPARALPVMSSIGSFGR